MPLPTNPKDRARAAKAVVDLMKLPAKDRTVAMQRARELEAAKKKG